MSHQHATIADTVYLYFASNDTSGSGDDGADPVFYVRLAGAAPGAAPVLSDSGILLTDVNFPTGAHEVAVAATVGNGFAAGNTYAVFCTLLVDSQNPTGFIGSFTLAPIISNVNEIFGTVLTEGGAGRLAAAFIKLFDVATPALVASDAMRGTDGANTTVPDPAGTGTAIAALIADLQTDLDTLTDARGEPGQGALPVSASTNLKVDYVYKILRNLKKTTASLIQIYNNAGDTVDHKMTIDDDGTTYTENEIGSGP